MTDRPTFYLELKSVGEITHAIAKMLLDKESEPISEFQFVDRGKLESALARPRSTFGGNDLYPTIYRKAAVLFYSMVKNHALPNGNKRVAVMTLFVFLYINHLFLDCTQEELRDLGMDTANSTNQEETERSIEGFLMVRCVPRGAGTAATFTTRVMKVFRGFRSPP